MNFNAVAYEASYGTSQQLPSSKLPEIVFSGRSNVGKSSMINKIFNRKALAKVSSVPGKTKTINFFKADNLRFADLPGYGYAKTSKNEIDRLKSILNTYFSSGRDILLVFQLIDIRHPATKEDINMINSYIDGGIPFVIILTKSDKLSKNQRKQRMDDFLLQIPCADQITFIPFSSLTGEGVDTVRNIIETFNEELIAAPADL